MIFLNWVLSRSLLSYGIAAQFFIAVGFKLSLHSARDTESLLRWIFSNFICGAAVLTTLSENDNSAFIQTCPRLPSPNFLSFPPVATH